MTLPSNEINEIINSEINEIINRLVPMFKDITQTDVEILLSNVATALFENHFKQLKDEVKTTLLDDMFERATEVAFDVLADARKNNETKF